MQGFLLTTIRLGAMQYPYNHTRTITYYDYTPIRLTTPHLSDILRPTFDWHHVSTVVTSDITIYYGICLFVMVGWKGYVAGNVGWSLHAPPHKMPLAYMPGDPNSATDMVNSVQVVIHSRVTLSPWQG